MWKKCCLKDLLIPVLMKPIGYISSPFKQKNGTPRQPSVCAMSHGSLTILKSTFPNPEHAFDGLEKFSHIWIVFLFHMNNNEYTKAKVRPPRLNGAKVGVFSTRCPYRPNPIGLTLAKIESIEGATINISGIDMINGTPVLDIKPYIFDYDKPGSYEYNEELEKSEVNEVEKQHLSGNTTTTGSIDSDLYVPHTSKKGHQKTKLPQELQMSADKGDVKNTHLDPMGIESATSNDESKASHTNEIQTDACEMKGKVDGEQPVFTEDATQAEWISSPPISKLIVRFTPSAEKDLDMFSKSSSDPNYKFMHFANVLNAKDAITKILQADPRSPYRRKKCADKLYYFAIDAFHVTVWFDDDAKISEVLKVKPVSLSKLGDLVASEGT